MALASVHTHYLNYLCKAVLSSHSTDVSIEAQRDYTTRPGGGRAGIPPRAICEFCAIHDYPSWSHHTPVTITIAHDFFSLPPNALPIWISQYNVITHLSFFSSFGIEVSPQRDHRGTQWESSGLRAGSQSVGLVSILPRISQMTGKGGGGGRPALGWSSFWSDPSAPAPCLWFLACLSLWKQRALKPVISSDSPFLSILSRAAPCLRGDHLLPNESTWSAFLNWPWDFCQFFHLVLIE